MNGKRGINMLLSEIQAVLNATVLTSETPDDLQNISIQNACGCDLMSDVLAFVKDQALLLTGLINSQVIRTAEMMDISAVCFVRGKTPPEDVIALADEKQIALLTTTYPLYTACGMLYEHGLGGDAHAKAL